MNDLLTRFVVTDLLPAKLLQFARKLGVARRALVQGFLVESHGLLARVPAALHIVCDKRIAEPAAFARARVGNVLALESVAINYIGGGLSAEAQWDDTKARLGLPLLLRKSLRAGRRRSCGRTQLGALRPPRIAHGLKLLLTHALGIRTNAIGDRLKPRQVGRRLNRLQHLPHGRGSGGFLTRPYDRSKRRCGRSSWRRRRHGRRC